MIHDGLERAARDFGDRVFVRMGDESWTFADIDERANGFARHLADAGVGPGDRVALMSTNRVEFVVAVEGISKLGAAAVLLGPAWKALEVDHALGLTSPVHAVADGPAVALLAERLKVTDLDSLDALPFCADSSVVGTEKSAQNEQGESVLVFSSGTTGLPKAVRHTHASMAHAIEHWRVALDLGPDDRFQVATPPTHILGLLNLVTAAAAGASVRLHARFDLEAVLRAIESDRITLEMAVAPIALAMANHPNLEDYDLSSLRFIMWGATPVTESVARRVTERTGVGWLPAYGASELPVIACNPVDRPGEWRLDSAGLPPAGVELRGADLDTGAPLDAGGVGEIQARSASVMAGYLPEDANADAFVDGWYRTGDVGWLEPEGWVHLTDRAKEMIKVSGFQVAPAEIETVLLGHPAVADCAVFGVPDERAGEVPVAAVQATASVPAAELQELVAGSLATYKQLRAVVFVDAVPRLPSGKALRRTLRQQWMKEHA
jgi:acyl-CoA synthetase (AMP-forming)/AMP-acid ligase II